MLLYRPYSKYVSVLAPPEAKDIQFQHLLIPTEIIEYYNIDEEVVDGYVYSKIKCVWYGPKEAGEIVHDV